MATDPTPSRSARRVHALALALMTTVLGGCMTLGHDDDRPVDPMTTEQARSQVVDSAKQINRVAGLQNAYAGFSFSSCNDQGDPPYRGVVELNFALPTGTPGKDYLDQVATTMARNGWTDGPPPDYHGYGRIVHQGGVVVVMSEGPKKGWAKAEIDGECRNMDDHEGDGGFDWQPVQLG